MNNIPLPEREKNFVPLQLVEGLLKKTVFAFMNPLEMQVEELSRRIERLTRRTNKFSKKGTA